MRVANLYLLVVRLDNITPNSFVRNWCEFHGITKRLYYIHTPNMLNDGVIHRVSYQFPGSHSE